MKDHTVGRTSPAVNTKYFTRPIWVDTSVFLVDRSDGYILDEIDNV